MSSTSVFNSAANLRSFAGKATPTPRVSNFKSTACEIDELSEVQASRTLTMIPLRYMGMTGIPLVARAPRVIENLAEDTYGKMRAVLELSNADDIQFLQDMHAYLSGVFGIETQPFFQRKDDANRYYIRVNWPASYVGGQKAGYQSLLVNDEFKDAVEVSKKFAANHLSAAKVIVKVWRRVNEDGLIKFGYTINFEELEFQ